MNRCMYEKMRWYIPTPTTPNGWINIYCEEINRDKFKVGSFPFDIDGLSFYSRY